MPDWTPNLEEEFEHLALLTVQAMRAITANDQHNRNGENRVFGEAAAGPTGTSGIGSTPLTYTLASAHQPGTLEPHFNGRRVPRVNRNSQIMWTVDSATQFSFTQAWQTNWIAGNAIEGGDEVIVDYYLIEPA